MKDQTINAIHASPLIRTQRTAEPLASTLGLPARVMPGLEEVSAGNLEMQNDSASVESYAACLIDRMEGNLNRRMPGGTTGHEFIERYDDCVRQITRNHAPEESVVVFSHGAAIRVYTAVATGMTAAGVRRLTIQNTGMSVLSRTSGTEWSLDTWRSDPLGGTALEGVTRNDVTGQAI